ncbi:MAG: hypothetical protein ACK4HE_03470 [Chitinophagaceae bacterium]|jgi:hypothetical protein
MSENRRRISIATLILIGAALGLIIKNIKLGMILGIIIGLAATGIAVYRKK